MESLKDNVMADEAADPDLRATGKEVIRRPRSDGRKGSKYHKATDAVRAQRVEWLARQLILNPSLKPGEVKALAKEKFGVKWSMALIYINRAKDLLARRASMTRDQAKEIGVNFLLDQLENGENGHRLSAERRLSEVFGYDAPRVTRIGDPEGKPLSPAVIAPTVVFALPEQKPVEIGGNGKPFKQVGNGQNGALNGETNHQKK